MDIIKIILTVLFIVIPLSGKLIEKYLKSAGKTDAQKKVHDVIEIFSDEDTDDETVGQDVVMEDAGDIYEPEPASMPQPVPEPVMQVAPEWSQTMWRSVEQTPAELMEGGYKSVKDIMRERQSVMKEDYKEAENKLDIDPKKLVIYSEIMNPKF